MQTKLDTQNKLVRVTAAFFLMTAAVRAGDLKIPYVFEQNQGQTDAQVRYLATGEGHKLFLTDREAVLALKRDGDSRYVLRMSLDGSRAPRSVRGLDSLAGRTTYMVGPQNEWTTDVRHYSRVEYKSVYSGIDLVYHAQQDKLEYDFVLAPGADARRIAMRFTGADAMRVNTTGDLELSMGDRVLTHLAPFAYQDFAGKRRQVTAAYRMRDGRVGFDIGDYDRTRPLIIDPVIVYSTFLGGDRYDEINAVAVDSAGNAYVTGEMMSNDFPIIGGGITPFQGALVYSFVTKINAQGNAIAYSAVLGGNSNTRGYGIAVNNNGEAHVVGVTGARNFPMVNPVQNNQPGLNIGYLAKINANGNAVLFSTYIGGERNDEAYGVALDPQGNIHVAGRVTSSQSFPTVNAIQSTFGGNTDIFVAKYRFPDYRPVYITLLGKTGLEFAYNVAADSSGATYITGQGNSAASLATPDAYQSKPVNNGHDAFAARLTPDGQLDWFTYVGGNSDDIGRAVEVVAGRVWIGGYTLSTNFPTTENAVQRTMRGDNDAFVAVLSNNGRALVHGTYLGSTTTRVSQPETVFAIKFDALARVHVAGVTNGADFPAVRPLQGFGGGTLDAFVATFDVATYQLTFSTPVGGADDEMALGLAVDPTGALYVGGHTESVNFPLKNAIRNMLSGSEEAFLTKVCDPYLIPSINPVIVSRHATEPVQLTSAVKISSCAPIPFSVTTQGSFLSANPATSTTDGVITLTFNSTGLEPGEYQGSITLTSPDAANSGLVVPVTFIQFPPLPVFSAAGVTNAASGANGGIAPGELIVIYGEKLGPKQLFTSVLDEQGNVAKQLKNVRVLFDGVPGAMIYTFEGQTSVVVPYSVAGKQSVNVQLEYFGVRNDPVSVPVRATVPGIFTLNGSGTGYGAILHGDYSVNGPDNPAAAGDVIIIYATGEGQTDPGGVDGRVAASVFPKPMAEVTLTIGGVQAEVLYAGAAPGLVSGVMQVNAKIPGGIGAGPQEVLLKAGQTVSRTGVTVAVK